MINEEIKDALSSGIRREKLRELVYKADVDTLLQDGLEKVLAGYTSFNEIYKLIEIDDELDSRYEEDAFREEHEVANSSENSTDILQEYPEISQNTEVLDLGSLK